MGFLDRLFGKKQNAGERHQVFFPFIIYDKGEKIEPNKWFQKASWKNKNFVRYKGNWGPDWKYASDIPGESNVKAVGLSRENRNIEIVKKKRLTTGLAFGMKALIVAVNNRVPYVEVCMSSIHNHNFSFYFTLPVLKKRVHLSF